MFRILGFGLAVAVVGGTVLSASAVADPGAASSCPTWRCGFNGPALDGFAAPAPALGAETTRLTATAIDGAAAVMGVGTGRLDIPATMLPGLPAGR